MRNPYDVACHPKNWIQDQYLNANYRNGAKDYFKSEGLLLKLAQAKLFLAIRFIGLILMFWLSEYVDSLYFLSIWIFVFAIALRIDKMNATERKTEFKRIYGETHYIEFYQNNLL